MLTRRYDVRQEPDGTWTVFDVFTGLPAIVSGYPAVAMLLNAYDMKSGLSYEGFT
ncbi:hypothetical protein NKJ26_27855 [Mesorhizobium sp. M0152]|uniref:hypothetical protein n=1 Tax=Mesorhizobium sp. M0152 TaxID=2956898 RepID=UPI00333D6271